MSTPNTDIRPLGFTVTEDAQPMLSGVNLLALAQTVGTPLYVLDEATIRAMASVYLDTLSTHYPAASLPLYACKANMSLGLVKLMEQLGMGLDVVSGGELYTAVQAQFPMEKIFFNGNNKSREEVALALTHRIGRITVDNFYELALIHEVASEMGVVADVLLRVTPGIDCHTHDYIRTGHIDSKFGFDLSYLSQAIDTIQTEYAGTIRLRGLHAHVGSQIFETRPYEDLAEVLLNIYFNVRAHYELTLTDLNIGGGLGIAYTEHDDPPDVADVLRRVTQKIARYAEELGYPLPRLMVEPGRSMVATAGLTLYTLGSVKEVPGVRTYVAVDGGMGDNIRPALYQAKYTAVVANKLNQPNSQVITVAGKYCESGDVLIPQLAVPEVAPGDTLMVFGTGAYNYAMASNYNRVPRPPVVLVENGRVHTLVNRETYETVMQQDLIPSYLLGESASAR
jgi:diaminopimelate decarboxylase